MFHWWSSPQWWTAALAEHAQLFVPRSRPKAVGDLFAMTSRDGTDVPVTDLSARDLQIHIARVELA